MALGSTVLVPIINPASVPGLIAIAGLLADADGGKVVPATVLPTDAGERARALAREVVVDAERRLEAVGVAARGLVVTHDDVATGVLEAAEDCEATLGLMGWRGQSTHRNVFGEIIDSIVGRSRIPLAVVRLGEHPFERILLPVSDDHLVPAGAGGIVLAAALAGQLRARSGASIRLLRTGAGARELPPVLRTLSDRVHHDPRRYALAVGAAADGADLVVVPVAPTASGLRTATTHIAWRAPDAALLVAVDVGPAPSDVRAATARAGQPAPASVAEPQRAHGDHRVAVSARIDRLEPSTAERLAAALAALGSVGEIEVFHDGRPVLRAEVSLPAATSNQALGLVMSALHEAPGFQGAELRYELLDESG